MLRLPKTIEVEAGGKQIRISFTEVTENVFVMKHSLYAVKNTDERVFGYMVYYDGYLYAWCVTPKETERHKLIYMVYIGSADHAELTEQKMLVICHAFAISAIQLSLNEHQHPAFVDKEAFAAIYNMLQLGLGKMKVEPETAYIQPIYDSALELRDFYSSMVESIEKLLPK